MRSSTAPKGKRDRASTEAKLLRAGIETFSRIGFDATTTKMISKKSGVNESLIMRYFGGKEGLLLEIIRRFFAENRARPLPYPPQPSLEAELLQYVKEACTKIYKHRALFRIMLLRAALDPKMRKKVLSVMAVDDDPKLAERFQLLKEKGKVSKSLDCRLFHLMAFQSLAAVFISEILFENEKQKEIQRCIEKLISTTVKALTV